MYRSSKLLYVRGSRGLNWTQAKEKERQLFNELKEFFEPIEEMITEYKKCKGINPYSSNPDEAGHEIQIQEARKTIRELRNKIENDFIPGPEHWASMTETEWREWYKERVRQEAARRYERRMEEE